MSQVKRPVSVLVIAGIVWISLACSIGSFIPQLGGDPTPTPELAVSIQPSAAAPTVAAKTPEPLSQPATQVSPTLRSSPTPASLQPAATNVPELPDIQAGLDQLDSYQMDFRIVLEGKDPNGKDAKQDLTLFQEVIKSKDSMHMKIEGAGLSTNLASGAVETFQIGKTGYLLAVGENQTTPTCISYSSDDPMVDMDTLAPENMLGQIQEQTLVARGEMVNGVKTDHYKITRGNLGIGTVTSENGDAWLAQDGKYLVRYTGQAEGEFELTGVKITGVMTWTYNLSKINQVSEIILAPECVAAGEASQDLPFPPNATDKSSFGEIITFTSPDSPNDVADFYRSELPVKGWKIDKDSSLQSIVILKISKDDRVFQIMISPGAGDKGSSVMITKTQ